MSFPYVLPSQSAQSTLFLQLLQQVPHWAISPCQSQVGTNQGPPSLQQSHGHRSQTQPCLYHPWLRGPWHLVTPMSSLHNKCVDCSEQPLLCSQEQEHTVNTHKYLFFRERVFTITRISFPLMPHQDPRELNKMGALTSRGAPTGTGRAEHCSPSPAPAHSGVVSSKGSAALSIIKGNFPSQSQEITQPFVCFICS